MGATTKTKTLGAIAADSPAATAVFERLGLDYCCGGGQTLEQACQAAGVSPEQVMAAIGQAVEAGRVTAQERNWTAESLAGLIAHICTTHHAYTRAAIERLQPLFEKVCAVHGKNHPELLEMTRVYERLAAELTLHLMKEERILFPYIEQLEEAATAKSAAPAAPFGSVQNPVAMMIREHDGAGDALRALRAASKEYVTPDDACASYRALYGALEALEADLHQHIHLENNILFPRAIELERSRR